MLEGLILLMTNQIKHVCQIKQRINRLNINRFNKITGINESKTLTNHISCKAKVNLEENMEENAIQINGGITIYINVNVQKVIYVKKTMF